MMSKSQQMMQSWRTNATAWTTAVRDRTIESRRLVTDAAIVEAILRSNPQSVLDMGCGEGWLCRALAEQGIAVVGIDGSPELIEQAKALGGGYVYAYDAMPDFERSFDAIVCNFSLLEEELDTVMQQLRSWLNPEGRVLIQTVHPWTMMEEGYQDGWRIEQFSRFGSTFPQAMPWYFRRLDAWMALLVESGFRVHRVTEPNHPVEGRPLSLLMEVGVS
jgi:2-polyprenyl-3-methyl-5-hydroxy-6-metoxy-1,4-benzoquinol methylase